MSEAGKEAREVNFDGLVGPSHNYAGLAYGNMASMSNRSLASNPREAALQGLAKMKLLSDLGIPQGILPPHERPRLDHLRRLGFQGEDGEVIEKAFRAEPRILATVYSASAMWAANAAVVSPAADCGDGRVHLTPANLSGEIHRSLEAEETERILRRIFFDERYFRVHQCVPASFADEGAANQIRFCSRHGNQGVELFVYGRSEDDDPQNRPGRYPARQSREASRAVARLHDLQEERTVFARQNPRAVDAGVFHNDVIALGNENVFIHHEQAFASGPDLLTRLERACRLNGGPELHHVEIKEGELSLSAAVESYLFNGQLVSLPTGGMIFLAPQEARENAAALRVLESLTERIPTLREIRFIDLRQSMQNGGGPACLRLRVVLTDAALAALPRGALLTAGLYGALVDCVRDRYRDRLLPEDLRDPQFIVECRETRAELLKRLGI